MDKLSAIRDQRGKYHLCLGRGKDGHRRFLRGENFSAEIWRISKSLLNMHWTLWNGSGDAIIINTHILGCYPDAGALQITVYECAH